MALATGHVQPSGLGRMLAWAVFGLGCTGAACLISREEPSSLTATSDANTETASSGQAANLNPTSTQALPGAAEPTHNSNAATFPVVRPRYTALGRFDVSDTNALTFSLANSRIGASFANSTTLSVLMADTGLDFFNVSIDGNAPIVIAGVTSQEPTIIKIASDLSLASHTVWLSKRTEFAQGQAGTATFYNFGLDANGTFLGGPQPPSRIIEASGDSGYTGYGVEGGSANCGFSTATQNADLSIPALTAQALEAWVVNNSWSGEGVVKSIYDPNNSQHTLPASWVRTIPPATAPVWGFVGYVPDVVLLSAGADDLANNNTSFVSPETPTTFAQGYAAWLTQIRQVYPKATIVCVLSQSATGSTSANTPSAKSTLGGAIQASIELVQAQTKTAGNPNGDPNIFYYDYFSNQPTQVPYTTYDDLAKPLGLNVGYGCGYHPSPSGALWLASRLAAVVKTHMGW